MFGATVVTPRFELVGVLEKSATYVWFVSWVKLLLTVGKIANGINLIEQNMMTMGMVKITSMTRSPMMMTTTRVMTGGSVSRWEDVRWSGSLSRGCTRFQKHASTWWSEWKGTFNNGSLATFYHTLPQAMSSSVTNLYQMWARWRQSRGFGECSIWKAENRPCCHKNAQTNGNDQKHNGI